MNKKNELVIFTTQDGEVKLDVNMAGETVWLNRQQMAELFDRDVKTISKHVNNALHEELSNEVVVANFATTSTHGAIPGKTQTHMVEYFNLDVIISVGYRVKSQRGVEFRRWANSVLKEYILRGYAVNDPSLEEKAANLLYFVTKNHSFSDGNKRIAATMFLYFLDMNDSLYSAGEKVIDDYTLVALTIMIAESRPEEKEMMINVVMNCIR